MKQINPDAQKKLIVILAIVAFIICAAVLLSGCKSSLHITKATADTTHVNKQDSGHVKGSSASAKNELEWWRETLNYSPGNRKDTNIYNYNTVTQPVQIIREGGKQSQQAQFNNYDSSWKKEIDSLKVHLTESEKKKQTQVLGFWSIFAIAIGTSLVIIIISKFLPNFKIVKI